MVVQMVRPTRGKVPQRSRQEKRSVSETFYWQVRIDGVYVEDARNSRAPRESKMSSRTSLQHTARKGLTAQAMLCGLSGSTESIVKLEKWTRQDSQYTQIPASNLFAANPEVGT